MRTVYTGGTFDLFHSGHVNFLRTCRKIAGISGRVVVGLNTDEFIYRYKNKYPVYTEGERRDILLSCKYVDEVRMNEAGENSTILIEKVVPDFIVIGSDWAKKDYYAQMGFTQNWLDTRDILLIYVPYTEGISSSMIRDTLRKEE